MASRRGKHAPREPTFRNIRVEPKRPPGPPAHASFQSSSSPSGVATAILLSPPRLWATILLCLVFVVSGALGMSKLALQPLRRARALAAVETGSLPEELGTVEDPPPPWPTSLQNLTAATARAIWEELVDRPSSPNDDDDGENAQPKVVQEPPAATDKVVTAAEIAAGALRKKVRC